jgi:UDPglucose 6-dehydrogenase
MRIAVIGSGFVGTVVGTCLAEMNHQVTCADLNANRMARLQQGKIPFYEDGLEPLLHGNLEDGRLSFTTDIQSAVRQAEVVFLCVGTPPLSDGKPDLSALTQAVSDVASGMDSYKLIVEKSTLPIKTGEWLAQLLRDKVPAGVDFDVACVPHFLREGYAVSDFMKADRVVIGAESDRAIQTLTQIFSQLNTPILFTDMNSAELIKHATNAFLAMKISFINSIAQVCEHTGADIRDVAKGLGLDNRIAPDYLQAGLGYGGIFFPKDIASLVSIAEEYHLNLDLVKTTETINRYQRIRFVEKIADSVGGDLEGKTIAIWGLAYRPNTDDMRNAPSIAVIQGLMNRGAKIRAYDPLTMPVAKSLLRGVTFCESPYDCAVGADTIAVLTSWDELVYLNFKKLASETTCRTVVDGRNLYKPSRMKALGFRYYSVGRRPALPDKAKPEPALATAGKKK